MSKEPTTHLKYNIEIVSTDNIRYLNKQFKGNNFNIPLT